MVNKHLRKSRSFTEFVVCGNFLAEVNLVEVFFCTKNFLYDRKLEKQRNGSLREINHMLFFEISTLYTTRYYVYDVPSFLMIYVGIIQTKYRPITPPGNVCRS